MPSHIEQLIEQSAQLSRFASNSRYYGVPLTTTKSADGRDIVFVQRRFVPSSKASYEDPQHTVVEGERPDHLAREILDDPERYWEICDHNLVRHAWELLAEPGATVLLPGSSRTNTSNFHPI